jgi:hypothetical protein
MGKVQGKIYVGEFFTAKALRREDDDIARHIAAIGVLRLL